MCITVVNRAEQVNRGFGNQLATKVEKNTFRFLFQTKSAGTLKNFTSYHAKSLVHVQHLATLQTVQARFQVTFSNGSTLEALNQSV